jgi:DNA polymerase III subunit delta
MAQNRKTAPSILDAVKNTKKGKLLPLYYLFGEDTYSLSLAVKVIEDAVSPFIVSDFDKDICYSDTRNLQDVINVARAFPFGSQKKLIIYKEAEKVKDKKLLEAYILSPPDFTVLVLVHNGKITNLTSSPFNLLLENNFLYEAKELKGDNMIEWVKELVASKGRQISTDNAVFLADISGENRLIIESQLEKTITFLGDKTEITFNAIKEVTASIKEHTVFDLQNAVFQKDKAAALKIAFNLLENGAEATLIINILTKSFIGLSQIREINEKKIPEVEAARIVGTHPFYLKNFQRASVLFSNNDLIKAAEALLKADVSTKTTSTDPKTVMALLIAELF